MPTRVITTNPAGHTVSKFPDNLSPFQVSRIYHEWYPQIHTWQEKGCIPAATYMRCTNPEGNTILYHIKWS